MTLFRGGQGGGGGGAVTFGNITQSTVDEDASTTHSVSHTATAGSNQAAVALVVSQASSNPSGVTYGGAAMTQIGSTFVAIAANLIRLSAWIKVAPASGAQTVEVTHGDPFKQYLSVISFTNVNQSGPTGSLITASGTNGTATLAVTDVGANDLALDFITNWTGGSTVVDAGQTGIGVQVVVGDTHINQSRKTGSGSISMTWDVTGTDAWGQIGFRIIAA